jgi:uncharacterized membrane protein
VKTRSSLQLGVVLVLGPYSLKVTVPVAVPGATVTVSVTDVPCTPPALATVVVVVVVGGGAQSDAGTSEALAVYSRVEPFQMLSVTEPVTAPLPGPVPSIISYP